MGCAPLCQLIIQYNTIFSHVKHNYLMEIVKLGTNFTHPQGSDLKNWEKIVFDRLEKHAISKYTDKNILLLHANNHGFWIWEHEHTIRTALSSPDWQVIFITMTDPCEIEQVFSDLGLDEKSHDFSEAGYTLDGDPYEFDSVAMIAAQRFKTYTQDELLLTDVKYRFISYSRKERYHRLLLTQSLVDQQLESHGIVTMGVNPDNHDWGHLCRTIGETPEQFADTGGLEVHGIYDHANVPHDLWSLGNLDLWQHHFLHVVNESMFLDFEDRRDHDRYAYRGACSVDGNPTKRKFVSEKIWKPIIGLRPFVLNMNPVMYQWLESRGFHTFREFWPVDVMDAPGPRMALKTHDKICQIIKWLTEMSEPDILTLYDRMRPQLHHNRVRFFDYAREQKEKFYACTEEVPHDN
jgi:hypothetical protein